MSMRICKKDEENPYFSIRQNPALRQGSVGICSIFKELNYERCLVSLWLSIIVTGKKVTCVTDFIFLLIFLVSG